MQTQGLGCPVSTAALTRPDPRPAMRLRRAPQFDPPYDDEQPAPRRHATGLARLRTARAALARADEARAAEADPDEPLPAPPSADPPGLDATLPAIPGGKRSPGTLDTRAADAPRAPGISEALPSGAAETPLAARVRATAGPTGSAGAGARPRAGGTGTEARLAVRRFVQACVEVFDGHRPAAHLRRLALPREAPAVVAQGLVAAQRVADVRRDLQKHTRQRRTVALTVAQLNLCEPRPGAVEAAVVLLCPARAWALALRLERHDTAWLATVLRLI